MKLQFTACFTEVGVYDLNKIQLTIFKDTQTNEILQTQEERKKCVHMQPITKGLHYNDLIVKIE